ncbi:MAG: hypothetical protein H6745_09160 [Deltaproteobacteria bacterium]|nr:hypothetical protein [Deltaproteobacteria bacterium]
MVPMTAHRLTALVEANAAGRPLDIETYLDDLDGDGVAAVERAARERLAELPTPLHASESPLALRRAALERLAAFAADRLGRPEGLMDVLRRDWLRGDSVIPLLLALDERGRGDEAHFTARLALIGAEGDEEERIERFLSEGGAPPDGWPDAVRAFARSPSVERFRDLLRFTPPAVYEARVRGTLRYLRRLGVPSDTVFKLATVDGIRSEAIELVESGLVSVEAVLARIAESPPETAPFWWGLAARAAFAQGDHFGTVRYLAEAYKRPESEYLPTIQAFDIREQASAELHEMLDRAGVPRFGR